MDYRYASRIVERTVTNPLRLMQHGSVGIEARDPGTLLVRALHISFIRPCFVRTRGAHPSRTHGRETHLFAFPTL